MTCCARPTIRFASSALLLCLVAGRAGAQQPTSAAPADEAVVGVLARLLAASDVRRFDEVLLRDGLQQSEAGVRRQTALAIGRIGDPAGVDLLINALADSVEGVRTAVAFSLGLLKDPRAVPPLLDLIRRTPPEQQGFAVFESVVALAKIGGPDGARAIQLILDGSEPGAVNQAVSRALLESWRLGPLAPVTSLVRWAQDPDALVRWNVFFALGRVGGATGFPILLGALQERDATLRAVALRGITASAALAAKQPRAAVVSRLRGLLRDDDPHVRMNALRSLATFRDSTVADAVAPLASDAVVGVAVAAETTLGAGGGALAAAALRGRLSSPVFGLRRQAAIGLAEADPAIGVAFADSLARDADWRWRSVAAEAYTGARDRKKLERLLDDPDARVVAMALEGLKAIVPDSDAALVARARLLLGHADPAVRSVAADILGRRPDVADVDPLLIAYRRAGNDQIPDARLSAVGALGAIDASGPTGRLAVTERFLSAVSRPDDYLVWRMAATSFPDALQQWGGTPTITTGRTDADYRDTARRYLYPALHGADNPTVTIDTDRGSIVIELLAGEAPLTVAAFLTLVDRRYFDGTHWHRVVPNFVVQDGDPRDDGWGGPGFVLRDEINPVRYQKGTVGMALSGADTGGSQYFITLGAEPRLDGTYPVFGRVTSDMSVLDAIAQGDRIRSIHR